MITFFIAIVAGGTSFALFNMVAGFGMGWSIFLGLLVFAVFLLIESESRGGCHQLYKAAWALFELPQALILIAGIGSACIEDMASH